MVFIRAWRFNSICTLSCGVLILSVLSAVAFKQGRRLIKGGVKQRNTVFVTPFDDVVALLLSIKAGNGATTVQLSLSFCVR